MRKELELIEQIEGYIMGKMGDLERENFKSKLNTDSGLQANVAFQQDFIKGLERAGLKADAQAAYKTYIFRKWLLIAALIIGVLTVATVFIMNVSGANNPEINTAPILTNQSNTVVTNWIPKKQFAVNYEKSFPEKTVFFNPLLSTIQTDSPKNDSSVIVAEDPKWNELTAIDILNANLYPEEYLRYMLQHGYVKGEIMDDIYYSFNNCAVLAANMDKFSINYYASIGQKGVRFSKRKRKQMQKTGILLRLAKNEKYFKLYKKKNRKYRILNTNNESVKNTELAATLPIDSLVKKYRYGGLDVTSKSDRLFVDDGAIERTKIKWRVGVYQVQNDVVDLVFYVDQKNGSYIYSINETGVYNMPTQFLFSGSEKLELLGSVKEYGIGTFKKEPNYSLQSVVRYGVGKQIAFVQRVKLNSVNAVIQVNYAYMICANGTKTYPPIEEVLTISIDMEEHFDCGVKTATIKTIKSPIYQNSNLATLEFEKRAPWIHKTCDNDILELYITNLDKNLSYVDSLVVKRLPEGEIRDKFAEFAAQKEGKMGDNFKYKIQNYYAVLQKERTLAERILEVDTTDSDLKMDLQPILFNCSKAFVPNQSTNNVQELEQSTEIEITAANAFSPDGDSKNDFYFFKLTEVYKEFNLKIKDKNGNLVYTTTDQNFKWYGKNLAGKQLPAGTYYCMVYTVNEKNKAFEVLLEVQIVL